MARQVLPIVGAVAGFAVGGPTGAQIGFALGSLVGNAVDPIEMQGRKLGDAPTQVAAEGGARAIVYGKGCIRATVVMERGGRRVIRQRDRSGGKGGGPTTINERALWTFAIGLGEPVAAILRIWENEKLVYDVTPTSTIPEDTAQFAEKFRFYDGNETQLPDPALEALHGVGDTPYYRGTAYMVFPQYDLTDFGETVPTYRVEVATEAESLAVNFIAAFQFSTNRTKFARSPSGDPGTWTLTADTAVVATKMAAGPDRIVRWGSSDQAFYSDDLANAWSAPVAISGSGGARQGGYIPELDQYIIGSSGSGHELGDGTSFANIPEPDIYAVSSGNGLIVSRNESDMRLAYRSIVGSWSVGALHGFSGATGIGSYGDEKFKFGGRSGSVPRVITTASGASVSVDTLPTFTSATEVTCLCFGQIGDLKIWVLGTDSGEIAYDNGSGWALANDSLPVICHQIAFNGKRFAMVGSAFGFDGYIITSENGADWDISRQSSTEAYTGIVSPYLAEPEFRADKIPLSTIVAALHDRAGQTASDYVVSELSEMVSGVVIESTSTAAEAINSVIGSHFADPSDYDGAIRYIKRGKPVVLTLTESDLIDEPDEAQRNNAIEYPKKVHFLGQRADLAYASSKSTSPRYSEDARVVGEITIGSPETYDDGTSPAEVAVKLHKVLWTEAEGEREWMIPDNYLKLVPTDNVGLSYRGELIRCRILNVEDTPGQRKLKMIRDRQSAYTANLTEIPNPPAPTPPQSSVVAPTVLAIIDTSALTDNADTLHYLAAMSGANDNWAGAALQQVLGSNFTTIDSTTLNSIMGVLQNTVTDASPYYTDTTNTATVRLYTDDELEAQSQSEFLSNGGAFFLSWDDSGKTHWEIMQFRDAVQDSNGDWVLSHFMRGRKDTETAEHPPGSTFVLIDQAILREAAQTSWLNTVLTHRAVSNGQSPELAAPQDNLYEGNSQREWPVANVLLDHSDPDTLEIQVVPRFRFGTSMNPIQSVNWLGLRITSTDGVNTETLDTTSFIHSFDVSGWGSPITVTVWQNNRLTGLSEPVIEVIP